LRGAKNIYFIRAYFFKGTVVTGYGSQNIFVQYDGRGDEQTCAYCVTTGNGSRINFCKFKNQDGAKSMIIAGFAHSPFTCFFDYFAEYQIFRGFVEN